MTNEIRVERARKRISQEDLANAVNVTRQTIHAMENNKYLPSLILATKIAYYFDMRIDELFKWEESDVVDVKK